MKMRDDDMELIHGSGNIFRDLGVPNPDMHQLKAILSARIIGTLRKRKLTLRAAQELTGIHASEFSRVCNANSGRFTIERLVNMLDKLGEEVELDVTFRRKTKSRAKAKAATAQPSAL